MKRRTNNIVLFTVIVFTSLCQCWFYKKVYIAGYKQAIKDEIEYIESLTDSIKGEIIILDRAIEKYKHMNVKPM